MFNRKKDFATMGNRETSIRKFYPNMIQMVDKAGGILPRLDVEQVWGKEMVAQAVKEEQLREINVTKNGHQPATRPALATKSWDESRPAWL